MVKRGPPKQIPDAPDLMTMNDAKYTYLSPKEPMQILFLPGVQIMIISKSFFEVAEPFGVGHFAAITTFHSKIVMKHFMVNDAGNDIFRDVASV
jgi:hypothetical protein